MILQEGNLLAANPYDLPGVRVLANAGQFELTDPPTYDNVKAFADMLGRKPVYGEDLPRLQSIYDSPNGIPDERIMTAVVSTGLADIIYPRNVYGPVTPKGAVTVVISGATIGWMPRRVAELVRWRETGWQIAQVYALASDTRLCDSDTERIHPLAVEYYTREGSYPREDYMLERLLREAGFAPVMIRAENLEQQAQKLAKMSSTVLMGPIGHPTNANATWTALRLRRVLRESYAGFDEHGDQFIFSQDGVPVAQTAVQNRDTLHYQRPLTILPAIGRTVEELFLLQQDQ